MTRRSILLLAGIALVLGGAHRGVGAGGDAMPPGPLPLADAQRAAIVEALQDEYQGEAIYTRVLKDLGEIRPFSNVVHAENRHASFLVELLTTRDLPVPGNDWAETPVPTYASRQEACAAAVEFEVRNVALYDRLLDAGEIPRDVRQAFEHNRMASLEHHKPAFERCASGGGGQGHGASATGRRGRGCGGHGCGHGGGGGCGRGGGGTCRGCGRGATSSD